MKPPIFIVCADEDVLAYRDPARALQYVESPDVEGGEYVAVFDAEGRRFELHAQRSGPQRKPSWWWFSLVEHVPVSLRALEEQPSGAGELRALLQSRVIGADVDTSLEELVEQALKVLPSP